jgi:flagellar hook-associated protein 2
VLTGTATGEANAGGLEHARAVRRRPGRHLAAAQDATVTLGSGDGAITISRSSNTITDLVPGASITLKKVTADEVTVTSSRDVDGGVKAVKDYVDALNSAIKTLADLSSYDAAAKKGGVLQGDATARQLLGSLRAAATGAAGVAGNTFTSAFQVGMSVDRDGKVTLDETKLRAALEQDFDAVGRLFGRTATATDPLATSVLGTRDTTPGTYQVEVTAAAETAKAVGTSYAPPADETQAKTFRITSGSRTATITIGPAHESAADVVAAINEALADAQITTVRAREGDAGEGPFVLEESRYGTANHFTVEELTGDGEDATVVEGGEVWGLEGTHAGANAEGRIRLVRPDGSTEEWAELTGTGRSLSATTGAAKGISLTWTGEGASDAPFELAYSHGLGGQMSDTLRAAEGMFGSVARARQGLTSRIAIFQTRIDGFEQRLATRESTLMRQFTAMETAMHRMNSQMSWLSSQIASMNAVNAQQR